MIPQCTCHIAGDGRALRCSRLLAAPYCLLMNRIVISSTIVSGFIMNNSFIFFGTYLHNIHENSIQNLRDQCLIRRMQQPVPVISNLVLPTRRSENHFRHCPFIRDTSGSVLVFRLLHSMCSSVINVVCCHSHCF